MNTDKPGPTIHCTACGAELTDDDLDCCPSCGADLSIAASAMLHRSPGPGIRIIAWIALTVMLVVAGVSVILLLRSSRQ